MRRIAAVATFAVAATTIAGTAVAGDDPFDDAPIPSTYAVAPVTDPDPEGGPAWGILTWQTKHGASCISTGRVVDGKIGRVDEKGVFAEGKPSGAACAGLAADGPTGQNSSSLSTTNVGARGCAEPPASPGDDAPVCTPHQMRTVFAGRFTDLKRVHVANADGSGGRDLQVSDGWYIAAFPGGPYDDRTKPHVDLYLDGCGPHGDELRQWRDVRVDGCDVILAGEGDRPARESAASKRARKHPSRPRPVRVTPHVAKRTDGVKVRFKVPITIQDGGEGYFVKVDGPRPCRKLLNDDAVWGGYDQVRGTWTELGLDLGSKERPWCKGRYTVSVSWVDGFEKKYAPFGSAHFRVK